MAALIAEDTVNKFTCYTQLSSSLMEKGGLVKGVVRGLWLLNHAIIEVAATK